MCFEIIDFHTHPFVDEKTNICAHREFCNMSKDNTIDVFKKLGVSKICGSVISIREEINRNNWNEIKKNNDTALLNIMLLCMFLYNIIILKIFI